MPPRGSPPDRRGPGAGTARSQPHKPMNPLHKITATLLITVLYLKFLMVLVYKAEGLPVTVLDISTYALCLVSIDFRRVCRRIFIPLGFPVLSARSEKDHRNGKGRSAGPGAEHPGNRPEEVLGGSRHEAMDRAFRTTHTPIP